MDSTGSPPAPAAPLSSVLWRRRGARLKRLLTTTQLLVLGLIALAAVGGYVLGTPSILWQLLLLPAVAGGVDLVLSGLRYSRWRVPWSGIATGLFLALLLPPASQGVAGSSTNLLLAGAFGALFAILGKHLLRVRGHPIFNPAASSLLLLAALWRITPAWWGAVSLPAVLVVGALIALRSPRRSAIAASFFAVYAALEVLQRIQFQGTASPTVLLLGVADPSVLFFTLLMAVEPRSAPSGIRWYVVYGLAMGLFAGGIGILAGTGSPVLATDSPLVGLVLANVIGLGLRLAVGAPTPTDSKRARGELAAHAARPLRGPKPRWNWSAQASLGLGAVLLLAIAGAVVVPFPVIGPPPVVVPVHVSACSHDNASIPASTLSMLHHRLGPSVILSYDAGTGVTLFYDPVNKLTIYETDLFEDYGSAEFNGDDSILANGCATANG